MNDRVAAMGAPAVGDRFPYPRDATVAATFFSQVERTPAAVAVTYDTETLTYGKLGAKTRAIAHALRRQGVKPGVTVGICAEPSARLVAAFAGILEAGGTYLPLDIAQPRERAAAMLSTAGAAVVICPEALAAAFSSQSVVTLERLWAEPTGAGAPPLSSAVRATDVAYIMFTSGSTGRPKGIAVPHRGITRLVKGTNYLQLGPTDVVVQASNVSFDAATFEIWGALLNGAKLAGINKETLLSPSALAAALSTTGASVMFVTTALFSAHARTDPAVFKSLSTLLFGGEVVDPRAVRRVVDACPRLRLLHMYGPTETTTFATFHEVTPTSLDEGEPLPIGRPIANTSVYVLSDTGEPVASGVTGEIWIGGDGVAQGYVGDTARSEAAFRSDPFAAPGDRMYRTGDRGWVNRAGELVFAGRDDDQVKLRGFRVELAEIEAVLVSHPSVRRAVVLCETTPQGDKRLVAFVDGTSDTGALRSFLADKLPDYMVPELFVCLPELPLSPQGKLDRAALRVRLGAADAPTNDSAASAPTDLRAAAARIWSEVLGVGEVSAEDSFLSLGGHSLRAMRIMTRVRELLHVDMPVRSLYEADSFAAWLVQVESAQRLAVPPNELARLVGDIESLSDAEVRARLYAPR